MVSQRKLQELLNCCVAFYVSVRGEMSCSGVPVKVPLNYKAMYLNLTEDLEENILSVQESLLDVSMRDLFCYFLLLYTVWE